MNFQRRVLGFLAFGLAWLLTGPGPAVAGWSADTTVGNAVCVAPGDVGDPVVVGDGEGGFIALWTDYRKPTFDPDLYCRRVNAQGDTLWGANGTVVCDAPGLQIRATMIPDGAGGAFIAWMDLRTIGGSQGYYLQNIRADGGRRWAANGIHPVDGFNSQYGPLICRDTTGGVFLAFASGNPGTQLQRIDSLGIKRLSSFPPAEGLLLHANPSAPAAMLADGTGGAIIAMNVGVGSTNDLAIQRATAAGTALWPAGGASISAAAGTQGPMDMVTDGAGGAIAAWTDGRNGASDIYAQHMSSSGSPLWAIDGIPLCVAPQIQSSVRLRALPAGGAVAGWLDFRHTPATSLYAQRVEADGSIIWTANGSPASSAAWSLERFTVVPAAGDSTFVVWNTTPGSGGDVFAQKLDGSGAKQWGEYGATLCRGPSSQTNSAAVQDASGGLFVVYRDDRAASNPDLFAQHIGSNGQPGPVTTSVPWARREGPPQLRSAPNPASGMQVVSFARPLATTARAEVFDIGGRLRAARALPAGATSWIWDGRDDSGTRLVPGVYLVRVAGMEGAAILRVVRVN